MSLLVVGALHWDVVVEADRLPRLDETLRGHGVAYRFGGKGGNQAVAAARAGAKVAFAGRIGGDAAGRSMREELERAGVDVSALQQGAGASGMSVAILNDAGDYGAVIVSAENHAFDVTKIALPADCQTVLLQNEMMPDVLPACAEAARAQGAAVIWNAAPAGGLTASDLALVGTLIVNRVEAEDILGHPPEADPIAAVAGLSRLAPQAEIILTLGADGVAFAEPGGTAVVQPALPVTVRSTHGAGDVFVGTYAASRLRDRTLSQAVADGQQSAAVHISQIR